MPSQRWTKDVHIHSVKKSIYVHICAPWFNQETSLGTIVLHRIFLSYVVDNNQQESIVGHSLPTVSERKFTDKCEWGIVRDTQVLALGRFFRTMSLRVLDVEVLCHYWTHISVYITASLRNHNHNLKSHFDGVRQFMGLPATAGAFNHSRWHERH